MNQNDELLHYGIKGQKWGIRRYQNPDGTLTSEGRKRAKREYKSDNREASERGYNATVMAKAAKIAKNNAAKAEAKYNKAILNDPDKEKKRTQRLYNNFVDKAEASKNLSVKSLNATKKAQDHCNELIKKYGKEAVKSIKYKDVKNNKAFREKTGESNTRIINEATKQDNLSRWASAGSVLAAFGAVSAGAPVAAFWRFPTSNDEAGWVVSAEYGAARKARRDKENNN